MEAVPTDSVPGMVTARPLRPNVRAEALAPAIVIAPAVPVAVPVSTVKLPELVVVPLELPVLTAREAVAVEFELGVLKLMVPVPEPTWIVVLLTESVPEPAPILTDVAAPKAFTVVAVALIRLKVVWLVRISPPLMLMSSLKVLSPARVWAVVETRPRSSISAVWRYMLAPDITAPLALLVWLSIAPTVVIPPPPPPR